MSNKVVTTTMKPRPLRSKAEKIAAAAIQEEHRPDRLDEALDVALETGRPTNLENAFPFPAPPVQGEPTRPGRVSGYEHEYRLKLLHRLLMRNLPTDVICQQLKVNAWQFNMMRSELLKRLKHETKAIDTYTYFGKTLAFYDEVRGTALRFATDTKMPAGARVGALASALNAEAGKTRFLETAGFFDHNRFAPPPAEKADSVERGRKSLGLIFNASRLSLEGSEDTAYTIDDDETAGLGFDPNDDVEVL